MSNVLERPDFNPWLMLFYAVIVLSLFSVVFAISYRQNQNRDNLGSRFCHVLGMEFSFHHDEVIRCLRQNPEGDYNYTDRLVNWTILEELYDTGN
jgi:hypothetical protein